MYIYRYEKSSLLNEKYRPMNLETYVGNAQFKKLYLNNYIKMIFKIIYFMAQQEQVKHTLLNLLLINLIVIIFILMPQMKGVLKLLVIKYQDLQVVMSFKPLKVVILDEADFLTIQAQASSP